MKFLLLLVLAACTSVKAPDAEVSIGAEDPEVVVHASPAAIPVVAVKPIFIIRKELTSSKAELEKLAKVAECILRNEAWLKEMGEQKFTGTKDSAAQVVERIRKGGAADVTIYKNSRFSPYTTLAYTSAGVIHMNTRYKWQAETLVHEVQHVWGYSHSSAGDFKSVPYAAGILAEKYVKGCAGK